MPLNKQSVSKQRDITTTATATKTTLQLQQQEQQQQQQQNYNKTPFCQKTWLFAMTWHDLLNCWILSGGTHTVKCTKYKQGSWNWLKTWASSEACQCWNFFASRLSNDNMSYSGHSDMLTFSTTVVMGTIPIPYRDTRYRIASYIPVSGIVLESDLKVSVSADTEILSIGIAFWVSCCHYPVHVPHIFYVPTPRSCVNKNT